MSGWNGVPAAVLATGFAAINCCFSAAAEEPPQPAFPYAGAIIARGIASRFIDGRTFILDDGREVRWAAIEVPPLPYRRNPAQRRAAPRRGMRLPDCSRAAKACCGRPSRKKPTATDASWRMPLPHATASNARCRRI
jgi:hypothetical protein